MEYDKNSKSTKIINESKLKSCINKYEKALEEYGEELSKIQKNINEALFNEYLITIKSRINKKTKIVRIIENEENEDYLIPIFTDEYEFVKGIETFDFSEKEIITEPYITKIDKFIEISKKDSNLIGLIINPHTQNFIIDMNSILEYNKKYF